VIVACRGFVFSGHLSETYALPPTNAHAGLRRIYAAPDIAPVLDGAPTIRLRGFGILPSVSNSGNPPHPEIVHGIERPDPALLTYYILVCLLTGPLFPIFIIPSYFRYHTMRYRFDGAGISMRWGILFRKEIHLTYTRIQDIHLTSNLIERWLGLARIQVQTASGSSSAEMTIEGIKSYELVRDFIYSKMRGHAAAPESPAVEPSRPADPLAEVAASLREASKELRALRSELEARKGRDV